MTLLDHQGEQIRTESYAVYTKRSYIITCVCSSSRKPLQYKNKNVANKRTCETVLHKASQDQSIPGDNIILGIIADNYIRKHHPLCITSSRYGVHASTRYRSCRNVCWVSDYSCRTDLYSGNCDYGILCRTEILPRITMPTCANVN